MRRVRGSPQLDAVRSVLQYLAARSIPVSSLRSVRATPLTALRDYLRKHANEPVPTETLVRMSGLTEWHLIRSFHLDFGLPPHAYHMRLRLAAAADLLSRGLSVSTAAYESGFADQSHLSRHFKAVYGLTPAGWARSIGALPNADLLPYLESLHG
jgi:AraC-like DNA-binding protein